MSETKKVDGYDGFLQMVWLEKLDNYLSENNTWFRKDGSIKSQEEFLLDGGLL